MLRARSSTRNAPAPLSLAAGVALFVLAFTGVLRAEPPPEDVASARAHYKLGVELYERGSYPEALVELQRANALAPTPKLLYNLALVQMRLGDWTGALHSLEAYVEGNGPQLTPARRTEVAALIVQCTAQSSMVAISANVEGARVTLDEAPVGVTPLGSPLRLNPGHHRIAASKDGWDRATKEVDLASGARVDVALVLGQAVAPGPVPIPAPEPEPAPPLVAPPLATEPAPPPPVHPEASTTPWVGWFVTGTLAMGAIVTGVAALAESHSLSNELAHPSAGSTLKSSHDRTLAFALVTDVLGGAALVAGGVTLYFTVVPRRSADGARAGVELPALGVSGRF